MTKGMLNLVANEKIYVDHRQQKIIPHPQLMGSFKFNAITGLATLDANQKIIWNFPHNVVSLETVLSLVDDRDRDTFNEQIHKREEITQTSVTRLKNGNKIQEIFQKEFMHGKNGDYEFASYKGIEGITRLVA